MEQNEENKEWTTGDEIRFLKKALKKKSKEKQLKFIKAYSDTMPNRTWIDIDKQEISDFLNRTLQNLLKEEL